jgi:sulfatase maturation enzyme AslB (radical SAM superfamily)
MDAAPLHEPGEAPNLRAFHVMTKPIGPICNLDCKYCFYLEKEKLFPANERFVIPDHVLEEYIRQYIEAQSSAEISFAWQGGEPTLLGVMRIPSVRLKCTASSRNRLLLHPVHSVSGAEG